MRSRVGAVPFVFGCFDARRLPGPILLTALGDLGIPETTARSLISHLVHLRQMTSHHLGRATAYELIGTMLRDLDRIRGGTPAPPWAGGFHTILYDVPESRRGRRDELRTDAFEHDYGSPRPGLLIGIQAPGRWLQPYLGHGPDSFVATGWLTCDMPTARGLARRSWPIEQAERDLRERIEIAKSAIREARAEALTDTPAFRAFYEAFAFSAPAELQIPPLPTELLSEPWPGQALRGYNDVLIEAYRSGVSAYVRRIVENSPYGPDVVAC